MEGTGIVAIISAILNLILLWWKKKDSPESVRNRIVEETKESLDELGNAIARDDKEDIRRWYADTVNRLLLKTSRDNKGGGDSRPR